MCTQPRQVACIEVAYYSAIQVNETVGGTIGYQIRFYKRTSSTTKVVYTTEWILVKKLLNQSALDTYGIVILDEVHLLTTTIAILMAIMNELISDKKVKLIVCSTTLDRDKFRHYFTSAKYLEMPIETFEPTTRNSQYVVTRPAL